MAPVFEVCLDSVASAIIAEKNGSKRIELCAGLMEGGITPSAGLIATVKAKTSLPVMVMWLVDAAQPMLGRSYFIHNAEHYERKLRSTTTSSSFSPASLKSNAVTFHRAFDMTKDPFQALEDIIEIGGIQRILTSGCERSAYEGLDMLVELSKRADGRIIIMPGAGITDRNVNKIVSAMNATEVHVGAGGTQESKMEFRNPYCSMGYAVSAPEYSLRITSGSKLDAMIQKF
ncbi:hypothetical protein BGX34_009955 [Mortierella sp. NVP85]|nr:hypothetical protein BGX34_009955 [Mortierella sp. NVP85]